MKSLKLLIISMVAVLLLTSSVSAYDQKVIGDYVITSGYDLDLTETQTFIANSQSSLKSDSYSIIEGQSRIHVFNPGHSCRRVIIDIDWSDKNNELRLDVESPDTIYGPFYDGIDGQVDGRIYISISKSSGGYLSEGDWANIIHGESISGTEYYNYAVYLK
ncbi:MAG: hypothetical protein WC248_05340 [Candidatus Methanomethylophilaceae archaeon]|jgi:hypothetical protein